MKEIVIVCADVGAVAKGNFGWWSSLGESGYRPATLAEHVSAALESGKPVALGFECPLFVPLVDDELFGNDNLKMTHRDHRKMTHPC